MNPHLLERFHGRMKTLAAGALLALAVLWAPAAWAQSSPGMINFQGRLTDTSNNPLSGTHGFIFSLYVAQTGGLPIWTETQNSVSVTNGVFAVQLGAISPLTSDLFAGATLFLQVNVDGVNLNPRERLVATAYAFSSERLQGYAAQYFVSTGPLTQQIAGDKTFIGKLTVSSVTFSGAASDPAGAAGALYFNSSTNKLRLHIGSGYVDVATGTIGGMSAVNVTASQFAGDGAATPLSLQSSSVTLQGNVFNAANKLLQLDGAGMVPLSHLSGIAASQLAAGAVETAKILDGAVTDAKLLGGISQSKVSSLTTDLGARLLKAGDTMSGDLTLGAATPVTVSTAGHLTLAALGSAPVITRGRLFYDSTGSGALKISLDGATFVPIATGVVSGIGSDPTKLSKAGDSMSGDLTVGAGTPVTVSTSGHLTLANLGGTPTATRGRIWFDPNALSGSGALKISLDGNSYVPISTGTSAGGISQVLSNATQFSGDGAGAALTLQSSTVTLMGNAFNAASKLLQLDGSALVPLAQLGNIGDGQVSNTANIAQSKISGLTTALGNRLLKAGDTMSGDLTLSNGAGVVQVSTSGYVTLAGLAGAPTAAAGRVYYDSTMRRLKISTGTGSADWVELSTGGAGSGIASIYSNSQQFSGDGASVGSELTLKSSSVTLQGNVFNAAGKLVQLDGTNRLPAVDGSLLTGLTDTTKLPLSGGALSGDLTLGAATPVTVSTAGYLSLAGNLAGSPNPKKGLVWFDPNALGGSGALKISLDGSSYVPISTGTSAGGISVVNATAAEFSGDGAGSPLKLVSSSVTLQGNVFNAANKLVRLDGSNRLPAVDGSLLTGMTDTTKLSKAGDSMSGDLVVGNVTNVTVSTEGHVTFSGLAGAPAASKGRIWFDPNYLGGSGGLKISLDGNSFVPITTGSASGGISAVNSTAAEFSGDGAGAPLKLVSSSVTLQGNVFNAANRLLKLDGSGLVPAANLGTITGAQLADGSVDSSKLAAGAVETGKIADGAVTEVKIGGTLSQSKVASLTTDLGARLLKAGDTMSGALQIGGVASVEATTISASGYLTLANLAAAPAAAAGRLYYDSSVKKVRISTGAGSSDWVEISTGGGIATVFSDSNQFGGNGTPGNLLTLQSSTVTLMGNAFNAADKLLKLDGSALVPLANLGGITGAQLAAGAVDSAKIAAGAVDSTKLAAGAVDSTKIPAGAIDSTKLAAGAVDSAKLALDPTSLYRVTGGTMAVSGGYVGIGTPTPTASLEVNQASGSNFQLDVSNPAYISLRIGGVEVARMKP